MTKLPLWAEEAKKLKDATGPQPWLKQYGVIHNTPEYTEFIAASHTNQDLYHSALTIALEALHEINFPAIWLDAGSDGVVKCAKEAIAKINEIGGER